VVYFVGPPGTADAVIRVQPKTAEIAHINPAASPLQKIGV